MNINILEIAVAAVILLFAVTGYRKGFVQKLAAMVSLLVSVVLVSALLPWITAFLKENTPVYTMIEEQCRTVVEKQVRWYFRGRRKVWMAVRRQIPRFFLAI